MKIRATLVRAGRRSLPKIDPKRFQYTKPEHVLEDARKASDGLLDAVYYYSTVLTWLKHNESVKTDPVAPKMIKVLETALKSLQHALNKAPTESSIKQLIDGSDPYKYQDQAKNVRKKAVTALLAFLPIYIKGEYKQYYARGRGKEPSLSIPYMVDDIWNNQGGVPEDITDLTMRKAQANALASALKTLVRQGKLVVSEGMDGSRIAKLFEPPEKIKDKLKS